MSERARIATKTPDVKNENTVSKARKPDFSQSITSPVDHILFLQRTIGNQAVQRLIKSKTLLAKLKIGQPGDVYEKEADRVGEQVRRLSEPEVQRQSEEEEEEPIQAKEVSGRTPNVTLNMETRLNALQGSGQPLLEADRSFMEKRFGSDFSGIRVHTDSEAVQMNRELNAQAFTNGRDIYFGAGRYSPETSSGKKLLAHELTHVVQQSAGSNNVTKENRGNIRCWTPLPSRIGSILLPLCVSLSLLCLPSLFRIYVSKQSLRRSEDFYPNSVVTSMLEI